MRHVVQPLYQVLVKRLTVTRHLSFMDFFERNCIWVFGTFLHHLEEAVYLSVIELSLLAGRIVLNCLCVPVDVKHLSSENTVFRMVVFERRCLLVKLS